MRKAPFAAAAFFGLLASATVLATVTEPNGLVVPLDSANGETQLYTLFQQLGEPIDWRIDAASSPHSFSPLCGFTAQFILHEAGFNLALAWYNETGVAPQPADLHVIIPAGAAVGTTISGVDIKNDPAYLGGLIGFALVGQQTHFSNPAWNPVCTGCNPPAPWYAAVVYPSKNTPHAFYIAFEDGSMGASAFNNDGDFNDDVYFLTGLTCSGGGQPCDTGLPGICAAGITQCTANGVTCQGLSQATTETCNGLDDDCNGTVDEGNLCSVGFVCDKGTCVESCSGGEFVCPGNKVCNADGYCVDPSCAAVTCPSGEVCVAGQCKGPCDGVVCPYPGVCRVGACVDPCSGVTCDSGQVCDAGVCVTSCNCQPCAPGLACDGASGLCLDPACVGMNCGAGTHCVAGQCVDSCAGAVCPSGQACEAGTCVPHAGGSGGGGAGGSPFAFGGGGHGATGGAGAGNGGPGNGADDLETSGSCGCRLPANSGAGALGFGLALAGALAFGMRRRQR